VRRSAFAIVRELGSVIIPRISRIILAVAHPAAAVVGSLVSVGKEATGAAVAVSAMRQLNESARSWATDCAKRHKGSYQLSWSKTLTRNQTQERAIR
jgi:hypothetical protein